MGRLVRIINNDVAVAYRYIATPDYRLDVEDYTGGATPPEGWIYIAEDLIPDDFHPVWHQPTGADNAYALGKIVQHNGQAWRSLLDANVWEPGVSGWVNATDAIATWVQPLGAHDAYADAALVKHSGKVWKSLLAANVWEPGVANWREQIMVLPDGPTIAEWIQPTGAGDAYALGAVVTHNGKTWRSDYAANVWEPGVYGWTEVV